MSFSLRGFTIVEVLIALAVSAAILAGGITAFSGRQTETQFNQAIFDAQSKFQNYFNQVSNKLVPGYQDYKCDDTGGVPGNPRPRLTASASGDETTNNACIYLGQAIEFQKGGTTLYSYPVFGLKIIPGGTAEDFPETPAQANPTIAATVSGPVMIAPYVLGDNLNIKSVKIEGDAQERDLLTVYSSLQDNNTSGNVITISAIAKTIVSHDVNQVKDCVETNGCGADVQSLLNKTLQLCIGDSDQSAILNLKGSATGVTTEIKRVSC